MAGNWEPQEVYEFGPYRLAARERLLLRNGTPVSLPARAFDVLLALIAADGQTLDKDQLIRQVWRSVAIGDNNLSQMISVLRKTLGHDARGHAYIETESGRGYRFTGPIRRVQGNLHTLAVLPFHSLGVNDELLELGMADTVISVLSESPEFVLRPTSAVRRYAGVAQDSLAAGKELEVDAVLEGTLQCALGRARVTLRLLRVSDGSSLWSGRLDRELNAREMGSVFELQDAVADLVANALLRRETASAEARKSYALGRHFLGRRTARDLERAAAHFQEAIAADPSHGRAWAGLADSYIMSGVLHYLPPKDSLGKAEPAAMKALLLDDGLAEAHLSLAMVRLYYDWDFAAAEREFAHALRLNPDYATAHLWHGWYLATTGDFEHAIAELRRAHELDPLSLVVRSAMGEVLNASGQADAARLQLRATLELDGRFALAHAAMARVEVMAGAFAEAAAEARLAIECSGGDSGMIATLGYIYGASGLRCEAEEVLAELQEAAARRYVSPYYLAMVSMGLEQFDRAFEYLEQAYQERSGYLIWLRHMPLFAPFPHEDPRFQKLLRADRHRRSPSSQRFRIFHKASNRARDFSRATVIKTAGSIRGIDRRTFLGAAGAGLLHAVPSRKPNVVLIVADDLGIAGASCYNDEQARTPHIDSIARDGVRFVQSYATASLCSPSRAGLITGRYQQRFGHEFNMGSPLRDLEQGLGLPLSEVTLADVMKEAGYATAAIGKWHLGNRPQFHPNRRGYGEFFGFPPQPCAPTSGRLPAMSSWAHSPRRTLCAT